MDLTNLYFTLTAVLIVFSVLFLLYLAYSLLGAAFTGKFRRKKSAPAAATAADGEVAAAIAMALQQYVNDTAHDSESYILTIKRK